MSKRKNTFLLLLLAMFLSDAFAWRDPTKPQTNNTNTDDSIIAVKMIKIKPGKAIANINDQIVQVGDRVNGMTIVTIKPDAVLLRTADNNLISAPFYPYSYIVNNNTGTNHANKK